MSWVRPIRKLWFYAYYDPYNSKKRFKLSDSSCERFCILFDIYYALEKYRGLQAVLRGEKFTTM